MTNSECRIGCTSAFALQNSHFASLADQLKRARATKETQLNRRVKLNLQLKQIEARLAEQKSRLLPP